MNYRFFIILALFTSSPAMAYTPFHSVVLYNESNGMKLSIVIPDEPNPKATFTTSTFDEATQTQPVISKVESIDTIIFADPKTDSFTGLWSNFGPNGKIDIEASPDGKNCFVKSTMREYYLPDTTTIGCSYAFTLGPKPAFTGSN